MEEIITKDNLDTYTQGLKGVLSSMGEAINNAGSSSQGMELTINISKKDEDTPYAVVTSGTKNVGTFYDGDMVIIPYGVEYTIKVYNGSGVKRDELSGVATKMACTEYGVANDYNFVDLGLPSGTLWADRNVGASGTSGNNSLGLYFSWGNINGHEAGSTYIFGSSTYSVSTGVASTASFTGDPTYDAATANLGAAFVTPTRALFLELVNNCTWTMENSSTRIAFVVTGPNGKVIYLPFWGQYSSISSTKFPAYYWSSTYNSSSSAYSLVMNSDPSKAVNTLNRYLGFLVRAVKRT